MWVTLRRMLAEIADHIRTQVLAGAALTSPIDRSYVAPGAQWALESCRQWVVHFAGTRREVLGGGRVPAQAGAGFPGPSASVPVHDLVGTFVACGHPASDDEDPAPAVDVNTWTLAFLADVEAISTVLAGIVVPPAMSGVPDLRLSIGATTQVGPQGGVARVSWPLSVQASA